MFKISNPQIPATAQRARAPIAPRITAKIPVGTVETPALGEEEAALAPD
jgi:hypothetical protein